MGRPNGTEPGEGRPLVVFVAVPSALGGSNRALVTALAAIGDRLTRIIAAPSEGALKATISQRSLMEGWIPISRSRRASRVARVLGALRLASWVMRRRHDVLAIHANTTTGFYVAAPAAFLSRVPLVVWVHDSVSTPWGRRLGPLLHRLLPDIRWLAVSTTARDVIVENGLSREADVTIVPNPIDPEEVVATVRPAGAAGKISVGFLGAVTEAKGFDLLPEVMRRTADLPLSWKLFVNREPGSTNPAWEQIDRLERIDIDVLGRVRDVRDAYGQCDVVFNPSRSESFSRVTAEALMNGIPVVASDLPAIRHLVGDHSGMLFGPGDATAAANVLRFLITDRSGPTAFVTSAAGRTWMFDPSTTANTLLEIYGLPQARVAEFPSAPQGGDDGAE